MALTVRPKTNGFGQKPHQLLPALFQALRAHVRAIEVHEVRRDHDCLGLVWRDRRASKSDTPLGNPALTLVSV